jgi:hypothetical protein
MKCSATAFAWLYASRRCGINRAAPNNCGNAAQFFVDDTAAMPHSLAMHAPLLTVIETDAYLAKARRILGDDEREEIVTTLAGKPLSGDVIRGGGGVRKVRFAARGKGKSGGVRVVYYYHSEHIPLFLLTVFSKGERSDMSDREVNQLAFVVKAIAKAYGA